MYKERDVPISISTLFEAHELSWNVGGGAAEGGWGERGSNLRGVSHSEDQHMVYTVGPMHTERETPTEKYVQF